jgi:hypothetical protein
MILYAQRFPYAWLLFVGAGTLALQAKAQTTAAKLPSHSSTTDRYS